MFAQSNALVARGDWYRIFTPVLVHASVTHILFNMYALYQLGRRWKSRVGVPSYVGLLLAAAGWGGAFAFYLGGPEDILVGASGAIFGLFGLWLHSALPAPRHGVRAEPALQPGHHPGLEPGASVSDPGISWQGHLGGLVAGILMGELWSRVKRPQRPLVALAMAALAVVAVII